MTNRPVYLRRLEDRYQWRRASVELAGPVALLVVVLSLIAVGVVW